jgi:hypothetical protein
MLAAGCRIMRCSCRPARRSGGAYVHREDTPQMPCLKCRRHLATHVCFPCGHLCICVSCAEELTLRFVGGETGITCPSCMEVIDCLIDAKPSKIFKTACGSREWLTWPMPTLFGRPNSFTSTVPTQPRRAL